MKEKQLELNLYDDLLHADALVKYMKERIYGSSTRLHLFYNATRLTDGRIHESYTLGTRTPGYETDYTYDFKITLEQAVHLYKKGTARTFSDKIIAASNMITCKICGCQKPKEELGIHHKSGDCIGTV